MTAQEKADKAYRILELIDSNVKHALKIQAYFYRAAYNDDVGKFFDQSKTAAGYNQVVDSLYFELILTIVRLYDDLNEKKHSENTGSLPELIKLLSQNAVIEELKIRSEQRKTPKGSLEKDLLMSDQKLLDKLKTNARHSAQSETSEMFALVNEFEKLKSSHLLSRLRAIRHELFVHIAIVRNRNNAACYGDAEKLLEKTRCFVYRLNSAIRNLHWDYQSHISTWQEHAEFFWQKVLGKENEKSQKNQGNEE